MLSVLLVTLSVWMLSLGVPKGVSAIDAGQVMPLPEVAGSSYALEAVLAEWYGLSLQVDQWQLSSVNCELRHSRLWTCALQMLRPGKPLKGDVPGIKGWELISQSETELNYRRTVAYSEAGRQSQAQPNHEAVTLQSLWRNYAHAFSRFHSLPPSPAFAPGPDTNQEAPIWLPGSQVFIEGPLRALVLARDAIGGLKNLQLELRVSAEPAMPSPKSQLMFSLSGVQL
ncbi:hypothetical protein L1889_08500 [Paenalcaligenes niemegkensis]|uniref:hypothetical protein n=1 Tax=Paenalcaligenes niemegkensis TaxID=2895469 RepID=UPI001EE8B368|nr:hypothetical protein [Paenalcaligenes niemegkensis]MCQ9616748.1 hypothetical protein [Paenalcaligenes niemegkensis]